MRRNVLLLQGPVGPFFQRFARDLQHNGFNVFKINFNGGDKFFYRNKQAVDYSGEVSEWEDFLSSFLVAHNIGRIYLFGDCRFYHKVARSVAEDLNIRVFVFEEGYIRPNFITLEEFGVNGNSQLLENDLDLGNTTPNKTRFEFADHVFRNMVVYAMAYYLASAALSHRFQGYVHHRPLNPLSEGSKWILSFYRKLKYGIAQQGMRHFFSSVSMSNKYFLCPLQVHCDMQVSAHSNYTSVEHFIGEVVKSFAANANRKHSLVFKHHPMDRGYTDYSTLIKKLTLDYGLEGRLYYVHDVDLPAMLKGARGTVLINSTVGLSSLLHGTPVITLGQAIYNVPNLTFQGELKDFWRKPGEVCKTSYIKFRDFLIHKNQINGNLYRRLRNKANHVGMMWSEDMLMDHTFTADRVDSPTPPTLKVIAGKDVSRVDSGLEQTGSDKLAS